MHTLMIHKSTDLVGPQIRQYSLRSYLSALTRSRHGWRLTGFNSIMLRPRRSGVPHHVGSTKFLLTLSASATLMFCQFGRCVTSEYTSTLTWHEGPRRYRRPVFCRSTSNQKCACTSSLPRYALVILVHALIVSKVDYCNSLLAGMSVQLHDRFRLIFTAKGPTTSLHCSGMSTGCMSVSVSGSSYVCWHKRCLHAAVPRRRPIPDGNRRHLRSADSQTLVVRPTRRSATVRFPWQLHMLGTVFHQPSGMRHHFCHSGAA